MFIKLTQYASPEKAAELNLELYLNVNHIVQVYEDEYGVTTVNTLTKNEILVSENAPTVMMKITNEISKAGAS